MLYVTNIDKPWVGYTQAALQYMMSLLTAGFEKWHYIPLQGADDVHEAGDEWGAAWRGAALGTARTYRDLPEWARPIAKPRMLPPIGTPESRIAVTKPVGYDLAVIHHTPDTTAVPELRRGKRANIGFTVTETDRIPWWLAEQLNELDGLITATAWNKAALVESGVTVPVHVVPHALGAYWWRPELTVVPDTESRFVFLYAGTWNERKNPADVVRAYLRAFPEADDTALALKLHFSKGQQRMLEAIVKAETGSVDRLDEETGDIWLYDGKYSAGEMRTMHAMADCYVSLHRGEGWGYGLHMAASLGKPVIYTDWSAPSEFMPQLTDNGIPVPVAEMVQASRPGNVSYFQTFPGEAPLQWAQPDLDAAVALLREARDTAQPDAAITPQLYGWEAVGRRFVEVIRQYEPDLV